MLWESESRLFMLLGRFKNPPVSDSSFSSQHENRITSEVIEQQTTDSDPALQAQKVMQCVINLLNVSY